MQYFINTSGANDYHVNMSIDSSSNKYIELNVPKLYFGDIISIADTNITTYVKGGNKIIQEFSNGQYSNIVQNSIEHISGGTSSSTIFYVRSIDSSGAFDANDYHLLMVRNLGKKYVELRAEDLKIGNINYSGDTHITTYVKGGNTIIQEFSNVTQFNKVVHSLNSTTSKMQYFINTSGANDYHVNMSIDSSSNKYIELNVPKLYFGDIISIADTNITTYVKGGNKIIQEFSNGQYSNIVQNSIEHISGGTSSSTIFYVRSIDSSGAFDANDYHLLMVRNLGKKYVELRAEDLKIGNINYSGDTHITTYVKGGNTIIQEFSNVTQFNKVVHSLNSTTSKMQYFINTNTTTDYHLLLARSPGNVKTIELRAEHLNIGNINHASDTHITTYVSSGRNIIEQFHDTNPNVSFTSITHDFNNAYDQVIPLHGTLNSPSIVIGRGNSEVNAIFGKWNYFKTITVPTYLYNGNTNPLTVQSNIKFRVISNDSYDVANMFLELGTWNGSTEHKKIYKFTSVSGVSATDDMPINDLS